MAEEPGSSSLHNGPDDVLVLQNFTDKTNDKYRVVPRHPWHQGGPYVGHQDDGTTDECKAEDAAENAVLKDTIFYTSYRVSAAAVEKYAEVSHRMGLTEWSARVPSTQPEVNSRALANFEGVEFSSTILSAMLVLSCPDIGMLLCSML